MGTKFRNLLLLMVLVCAPSFGAITLIQSATSTNNAASGTITLTTATGAGNLLVAYVEANHVGGLATLTSTSGTWTKLSTTQNDATHYIEIWNAPNITGAASEVINWTLSSADYFSVTIAEYSGAATSAPAGAALAASGSGTAADSGLFTVATTSLIAGEVMCSAHSSSNGTGFTLLGSPDGFSLGESKLAGSTSEHATATCLSGGTWLIIGQEFKAAGAAPNAAKHRML